MKVNNKVYFLTCLVEVIQKLTKCPENIMLQLLLALA